MNRLESQNPYNRAAKSYGQVGPPLFAHFGQRLADLAGLLPDMSVLDVGAATSVSGESREALPSIVFGRTWRPSAGAARVL